jgi:Tfp pilus assembly PilM family ATPase
MADRTLAKSISAGRFRLKLGRQAKARRSGPVAAIELDDQWVRVAQTGTRGTSTVVTRVAVAPLPIAAGADRKDPAAVGAALSQALDGLRVKPSQVVIGVPRHSVVLRTLVLPALEDERELASMVHMQIGRDLPFRQDEAIIDFKVRPGHTPAAQESNGQGKEALKTAKQEVLVAAVRKETAEFYQKVASAAKLKLIGLGWLSEANARAVGACQVSQGKQGLALVTLRADEVGIDVVAGESLVFSRGAGIQRGEEGASAEATAASLDPAAYLEAVIIEVVRSIHSYGGMEGALPIEQVAMVGATGQEQAVLAALQSRLSIPCKLLDPAASFELTGEAGQQAADALAVMGLGLGVSDEGGLPFDFLNPKRPAVQRDMKRIRMLAGGVLGAALLIGLVGVRSHLVKERLKVQQAVKTELGKAEKFLPTYRKMQQQAATIQNWSKGSRNWLDQLAYLSTVLPASEEVYLTSLTVSGQGVIHMAVQARSGEILAELDRELRKAGYELKPLAITPGNDKHGYNFRSTVELIAPAKMQIDLAKAQPPTRPADDGSLEGKPRAGRKGGGS